MKRLLLFILILTGVSCSKITESEIPYAPVYFTLDLRFQDKDLVGSLHYKTFTAPRNAGESVGFSGIVVINGYSGYYAYDLCCPHEALQSTRIEPTNAGTAICPKCETVYDLSNGIGNPMSGPSEYTLRRYNVTNYAQELIIRN